MRSGLARNPARRSWLAAILAAMLPAAVSGASPEEVEFFEKRIRPILAQHCYECHAQDAPIVQGGLLLDSGRAIRAGGDSGPAVVPGKPEESRLVTAIGYQDPDFQMPPAGRLPQRDIDRLIEWVRRGAVVPEEPTAGSGPPRREIDFAAGRRFWSFQPLARHRPPTVRQADWPREPLDAFILARLEAEGLSPSPPADRRTLIRRAAMDLTGLPPSPEEVEAFISDPADDAYERLVDRLLESPHYGERWARYWLDLVRYCDQTDSYLEKIERAYLYRDWVVQALNRDLPYDEFVRRQIAADQIPEAALEDLAALGFLGLSPTYWKELKLAPEVIRTVVAEEWEERVDAVSRVVLGLTVACARCHDHKYDPISQQDYYGLAGVLASTRLIDRPLAPLEHAQTLAAARQKVAVLEAEIAKLTKQPPDDAGAQAQVAQHRAEIETIRQQTPYFDAPWVHAVDDAGLLVLPDGPQRTRLEYRPGEPQDLAVHVRGNPNNLGPVVPRRFLTVLSADVPRPLTTGSGRVDLADALVREAGPLAARVIVNRVWQHHFGRGLVTTPSDFGTQGAPPSHPELLDDLAARFVDAGWSLKWLHRRIMLSATYRQASTFDAARHAADPDNRWLWRMNRRRLEVEAWRDAMLTVTGQLDRRLGGPAQNLDDPANVRRTIYGLVHRREMHAMLRLYDFPDPERHAPNRERTTTPLQQLFVLNSPLMQGQAAALARRVMADPSGGVPQQVQRVYGWLFGRLPTPRETELAVAFLTADQPMPTEAAWREYAQALLGSNEFLFVD